MRTVSGDEPERVACEAVPYRMCAARVPAAVFFVRNLGFVHASAARRISFADSLAFECVHEETYRDLGFRLIDIPAGPLADRVPLIERAVRGLP